MKFIAVNPSLCPGETFPKNPAIVVVCPTNSIEQQMEENMAKLGISALMIDSDTVAAARILGRDLWEQARETVSMLILGPEQLISKGFQDSLKHEPFFDRVYPKVADAIFNMLGVNRREFYLIRRSNSRHDIQLLFCTLYSGIDGLYFSELGWVVENLDKTIIFCATISLAFRVTIYRDSLLPDGVDRTLRVRTSHSINWPDENMETIALFKTDPRCQVIVATNGLAQGNDIPVIKTVIEVGEPESAEMFVQKPGRGAHIIDSVIPSTGSRICPVEFLGYHNKVKNP
ncbi:hypothetical protein B0H17DRAFT_1219660 [Mycena rosella]|uniref:DNA 3'-5' helicase n=1 Tax=Mycena rosella TaxID=1033263 RepID=A0AAD7BGB1_MYCRO|nr:hypothetical protein B0H17DRAFT_1219660 [Mycena rosella]